MTLDLRSLAIANSYSPRQVGKTTALLKLLKENPKAWLIVASEIEKDRLERLEPELKGRIVNVNFADRHLRGRRDFYPIYDHAVMDMFFNQAIKNEVDKERLQKKLDLINELI